MNEVQVGDVVVYHDPVARPFNALVIAVWTATCINLITIEGDTDRTDTYGRQTRRITSCSHKSVMSVHGNYWRRPDEEPNPIVEPLAN